MNPEIKAQWVAALRSGEYWQGQGRLAAATEESDPEISYCCLGVLCDLAVKAGVDVTVETDGSGGKTFDGGRDFPPPKVLEWSGLEDHQWGLPQAVYFDDNQFDDLASLNDNGATFDQIADIIEEQL